MLLPWHKPVKLVLSPSGVTLHLDKEVLFSPFTSTEMNQTDLLNELETLLAPYKQELRATKVTVVLSNFFVRYAILPWREGINRQKDWTAIAQNYLRDIYGPKSLVWQTEVVLQGYGKPILVAAVDKAIIEKFELFAKQQNWSLHSIEPAFITVVNHYSNQLNQEAWLLVAEPERLLLANAQSGIWSQISMSIPFHGEEHQQIISMLTQASGVIQNDRVVQLFYHGDKTLLPTDLEPNFVTHYLSDKKHGKRSAYPLSYGYL